MAAQQPKLHGIGVIPPDTHLVRAHGPFRLRRIWPGASADDPEDAGFAGLGVIDHANLQPGLVVKMHEHRNDEIISYLRSGQMRHTDSANRREIISNSRLMVMNAGRGFSHEEEVVGDEPINMLQIFVRPSDADLDPEVHFLDLDNDERVNRWRLLTGPIGSDAPTHVRQQIYLYDAHLSAGSELQLPSRPGFDGWFYVFAGAVTVGDHAAETHTALTVSRELGSAPLTARTDSDVVFFLVDRSAPFSLAGTISGKG